MRRQSLLKHKFMFVVSKHLYFIFQIKPHKGYVECNIGFICKNCFVIHYKGFTKKTSNIFTAKRTATKYFLHKAQTPTMHWIFLWYRFIIPILCFVWKNKKMSSQLVMDREQFASFTKLLLSFWDKVLQTMLCKLIVSL